MSAVEVTDIDRQAALELLAEIRSPSEETVQAVATELAKLRATIAKPPMKVWLHAVDVAPVTRREPQVPTPPPWVRAERNVTIRLVVSSAAAVKVLIHAMQAADGIDFDAGGVVDVIRKRQ